VNVMEQMNDKKYYNIIKNVDKNFGNDFKKHSVVFSIVHNTLFLTRVNIEFTLVN